jgi:hypothetical protein
VRHGNIAYLAHPVFSLYRTYGAVAYREYLSKAIASLLSEHATLITSLPSTARVSLNLQPSERRYVLHLLYANTISRGGAMNLSGGNLSGSGQTIEVIEDLLPLGAIEVSLANMPPISKATLEPQGCEISLDQQGGRLKLQVDGFTCHQMVVLHMK